MCVLFIVIVCTQYRMHSPQGVCEGHRAALQFVLFPPFCGSCQQAFTIEPSCQPLLVFKLSDLLFNSERTILKLRSPENPDEKARLSGTISLVHY